MSNNTNSLQLYTREEVADLLKVSVATIDLWRRKGLLKGVKIERSVRFTHEEVKKLMEKYQNGTDQ